MLTFPPALAKLLLPFPGEGLPLKLKTPATLEKSLGFKLPAKLDVATEAKRGDALGINRRYDAKGNNLRSPIGAALIDLWVQRGGLAFATEALIRTCSLPVPRTHSSLTDWELRADGQPWRRLREHLAAAKDISAQQAIAASAWKKSSANGDLRAALAFAFCHPPWVTNQIEPMFKGGYGRWAVLTAITNPKQAVEVAKRLLKHDPAYQLYEEAIPHLPTLVKTMGAAGRPVLEKMTACAYTKKEQKFFAALLACLD